MQRVAILQQLIALHWFQRQEGLSVLHQSQEDAGLYIAEIRRNS